MNKLVKGVILNKSQGEIDWLVYNQNNLFSRDDLIYVYCNIIDKDVAINYAPNFFSQENVRVFNLVDIINNRYNLKVFKLDVFFERISSFMINKVNNRSMQNLTELSLVFVRRAIASILIYSVNNDVKFNEIFFENNFRSSLLFEVLKKRRKSSGTEVTLFPHHFGPLEKTTKLTRLIIQALNISRCLVNNNSEAEGIYKYLPSKKEKLPTSLGLGIQDRTFLLLTRQCSTHYGFEYTEAFKCFEKALIGIRSLYPNAVIKIKNHPRDLKRSTWNELSSNYGGEEIFTSAVDFCAKNQHLVCIHFYTSLVEPLSGMGIKCLDISPYKAYKDTNFAFYQIDGKITNSYIEQKKTQSILAENVTDYI